MAERLEEGLPIRGSKHPDWSQWADGSAWLLTRGEDFGTTPENAGAAFRGWAYKHGFSARVSVRGDHELAIQAVKRGSGG